MISADTFSFLKDIEQNNNRDWFQDNKERYLDAKKELEEFAEKWLIESRPVDASLCSPDVKPYVFRIYRDARFAKGRPYKNNLGLMLLAGGRPAMHHRSGFYLHIQPGNSFFAVGAYMPPASWLASIRESIAEKPEVLRKILKSASFKKYFHLTGSQLKTGPKGYPKDHEAIDLLKYKDLMAISYFSDKEVKDPAFLQNLMKVCKAVMPFNDYLNDRL